MPPSTLLIKNPISFSLGEVYEEYSLLIDLPGIERLKCCPGKKFKFDLSK